MTDRREFLQRFVAEVRDQQVANRDHFAIPRDVAEFIAEGFEAYLVQEGRPSLDVAFALRKRGERDRRPSNDEIKKLITVEEMRDAGATWPAIEKATGEGQESLRGKLSRHRSRIEAFKIARGVHMMHLRRGLKEMG